MYVKSPVEGMTRAGKRRTRSDHYSQELTGSETSLLRSEAGRSEAVKVLALILLQEQPPPSLSAVSSPAARVHTRRDGHRYLRHRAAIATLHPGSRLGEQWLLCLLPQKRTSLLALAVPFFSSCPLCVPRGRHPKFVTATEFFSCKFLHFSLL
jgi:hypothetical protein